MTGHHERYSPNGSVEPGNHKTGDQKGKEAREETINRGELYFLWHPTTSDTFSGYGLTMQPGSKELLAGLLMVDRPQPVDPDWLRQVEQTFGECDLVEMTATRERGIACQMRIEPASLPYVQQSPTEQAGAIAQALQPLLEELPKPYFRLRWDEAQELWTSEMVPPFGLPLELREVFERIGSGCIPTETNIGIVHVCHAAGQDIEGFVDKPVSCQWQLVFMPTAPVLRLKTSIIDRPDNPYRFESFLHVGDNDDARTLETLLSQEWLYLAFYGEDFSHRFTKVLEHHETQREQLHRLGELALDYWHQLPPYQRDFNRAKAEFQRRFPL